MFVSFIYSLVPFCPYSCAILPNFLHVPIIQLSQRKGSEIRVLYFVIISLVIGYTAPLATSSIFMGLTCSAMLYFKYCMYKLLMNVFSDAADILAGGGDKKVAW